MAAAGDSPPESQRPRLEELRLLTLRQAADLTSVSETELRRAIRATVGNWLPAKKLGRQYRIRPADLAAWIERLDDA